MTDRTHPDSGEILDPGTMPGLQAEIERLRAELDTLKAQEPVKIGYPQFHEQGMGCGLEDRCITDRYEAMRYGYEEALDQMDQILKSYGPLYAAPVPSVPEQLQCWSKDDPEHGAFDPSDMAEYFADNMYDDESHVFDVLVSITLPDRQMRVTLEGGEERELHWEWVEAPKPGEPT